MIRTVIIPDTEDISIHLPGRYIGKKIEILLYAEDELTEEKSVKKIIDNSALRGALHLTEEQSKDFQQHAKDIRNEWNADI